MEQPMPMVKNDTMIHPQIMTAGPPAVRPVVYRMLMLGMTDTAVKQNEKLMNAEKPRMSSCL